MHPRLPSSPPPPLDPPATHNTKHTFTQTTPPTHINHYTTYTHTHANHTTYTYTQTTSHISIQTHHPNHITHTHKNHITHSYKPHHTHSHKPHHTHTHTSHDTTHSYEPPHHPDILIHTTPPTHQPIKNFACTLVQISPAPSLTNQPQQAATSQAWNSNQPQGICCDLYATISVRITYIV